MILEFTFKFGTGSLTIVFSIINSFSISPLNSLIIKANKTSAIIRYFVPYNSISYNLKYCGFVNKSFANSIELTSKYSWCLLCNCIIVSFESLLIKVHCILYASFILIINVIQFYFLGQFIIFPIGISNEKIKYKLVDVQFSNNTNFNFFKFEENNKFPIF